MSDWPRNIVATDPIWDAKGDVIAGTGPEAAARTAVGANGRVLTADSTQTAGIGWGLGGEMFATANLVPPLFLMALQSGAAVASAANTIWWWQFVMPRSGTIAGMAVCPATASGNMIGAIYDNGEASSGNGTKLADSGSVAVPSSGAYKEFWAPNLAVTKGQFIRCCTLYDNTTVSLARFAVSNASLFAFPSTWGTGVAGALTLKMGGQVTNGAFSAPSTIADASWATFSVSTNYPVIYLRLT